MPSHLDFIFPSILIDFGSQLRLPEPSKLLFILKKNVTFSKNPFSQWTSIFDRFWYQPAFYFLFPSKDLPTSQTISILKGIDFLIDFCIDVLTIWARLWWPTWLHCGHVFLINGAEEFGASLFLLDPCYFSSCWGEPRATFDIVYPIWEHPC